MARHLEVFGFGRVPAVVDGRALDKLAAACDWMIGPASSVHATERVTEFDVLERMPELAAIAHGDVVRDIRDAFFGRASHIVASDANLLVGDSYWHSDGSYQTPFLRFVLYLEPVTAKDGALRAFPGSHRPDNGWAGEPTRNIMRHDADLGRSGAHLPAAVIDSQPGDLIVFDTNVLHSAWNGGRRRQLAFNVAGEPRTDTERADTSRYVLNRYVSGSVRLA
ncbi:phytanoyl-CoA dioxygenase family protein [Micromonospora sp. NPDC049240]|uniref:phytanoyl-CoA dioxygenase family protein n=1 Tax=Micromonospora sp. NPDC049240 TaxID=3155151 RepID=UPI0033E20C00